MSQFYEHSDILIVSATINEYGQMEVVRKYKSNVCYANGKPCPDKVVKEIYVSGNDGKIFLFDTIEGKHTPAYTVKEKIEF